MNTRPHSGFPAIPAAFFLSWCLLCLAPCISHSTDANSMIAQGDRYLSLGRNDDAILYFNRALESAGSEKSALRASVLNRLGTAYIRRASANIQGAEESGAGKVRSLRVVSKDQAEELLNEALAIAQEVGETQLLASVLNNLGNLAYRKKHEDKAFAYYIQSSAAGKDTVAASASLNASIVMMNKGKTAEAKMYLKKGFDESRSPGDDPVKAENLLLAGWLFQQIAENDAKAEQALLPQSASAYEAALSMAERLGNDTVASYALGYHGRLLEKSKRHVEALALTRKALFKAQEINSPDLLYQWHWQLARLKQSAGDAPGAVKSYRASIQHLQTVRQAFEGCSNCRINFSESIEAVYLGYAEILLSLASGSSAVENGALMQELIETIEQLRTAELQNYFKDACLDIRKDFRNNIKSAIGDVHGKTAFVYLITLPEKLEIVALLPDGVRRFTTVVNRLQLSREVIQFRTALTRTSEEYLPHARKIYDWVLRPLERELAKQGIETLVVLPDGMLRTIPFSALHDGNGFAIAKYAFATTQGLQLTDMSGVQKKSSVLIAGLTESVEGFPPLPFVGDEVNGIKKIFEHDVLMNSDFVRPSIQSSVERRPYSMVHFATHGEFSGDSSNMYLLAWDGLLTMNQLDRLIKVTKYREEPLELLTLSACKTAAGDDQAALGMAGIAVRAGAKSTVATLWEIDDRATSELIIEFYRQLKNSSLSKSAALRNAQLKVMSNYRHPYFWSPFLLIGNWK